MEWTNPYCCSELKRSQSQSHDPRRHVLSLLTSGTDVYPEMNVLFTHAL